MLEQVGEYIRRNRMLSGGDRVVVAVSGGPDSVALLHLLHGLSGEFGLHLHVFHMDHGLRGEESAEDARYVRALSESLRLPCQVVSLPPGALRAWGGSLQAAARAVRYRELEAFAASAGANRVALGHNRDDQAETVLMRMLRGAGVRGLAGIPPVRGQNSFTYIRPLLATPRQEIDKYCRERELSPRLDRSNLKTDYLRNRIRLELLPHLAREFNPAIAANLSYTATILRDEDDLLESLAAEAFQRSRVPGEGVSLLGSVLLAEHLALARRVVRQAARAVMGPEFDLGLEAVSQVLDAVAEVRGTRQLDLPGGLRVRVEYGTCRFLLPTEPQGLRLSGEWNIALAGETIVPELGIRIEVQRGQAPAGSAEATFDADRLPGPLSLRFRRPGDRLWPVGMDGSKKLQDILVDAKVPRRLRDHIPLIVSGNEVLWILGHRLDRRFLATDASRNTLKLRVSAWNGQG